MTNIGTSFMSAVPVNLRIFNDGHGDGHAKTFLKVVVGRINNKNKKNKKKFFPATRERA